MFATSTTCRYTFGQPLMRVVQGSVCLSDSSSGRSDPFIITDSFISSFSSGPIPFDNIPNKDGYCTLLEELVSAYLQQRTFYLSKLYINQLFI